ncbi:hypothetical protein OAA06_01325 [bacterium]|nr:hypothetical protein [bacterium]
MRTYDKWMEDMEQKAQLLPRVQARFMNFEVLPRLGKWLSENNSTCSVCKGYWVELQKSTEYLDLFFEDGNNYSKDFDDLVEEILNHLKDEHQIRPKGQRLSLTVVLGMLIGVVIGAIVGGVVFHDFLKAGVLLGWVLGTVIGWTYGKVQERSLSKESRLF